VTPRVGDRGAGARGLRGYTPPGTGPFPLLVFFHGSGWVVCDGSVKNLGQAGA